MSRNLYGGGEDDYAVDAAGNPAQNRRVHFYTGTARTTEITDLASDAAGTGTPLTVTTDSQGFWGPVYGPDGTTVMYAGAEDSKGNAPTRVVAVYTHSAPAAASPRSTPADRRHHPRQGRRHRHRPGRQRRRLRERRRARLDRVDARPSGATVVRLDRLSQPEQRSDERRVDRHRQQGGQALHRLRLGHDRERAGF
jgi:hypothetical protein